MFPRKSSSLGQRSSVSSSSSPPSAVVLSSADDGCSSDDGSVGHDDNNYKLSKEQNKKTRQPRRSLVDQLRLSFLTGRLSRRFVQSISLLAMGAVSYAVSFRMIGFVVQESTTIKNHGFTQKPRMMAVFFTDVKSNTFTIKRMRPPSDGEFRELMDKRRQRHLQDEHQHHRRRHHNEKEEKPPLQVEPLSKKYKEIEQASSFYDGEKPEITPNPEKCTPQYEWQTHSYPACNSIHENTMMHDRMFLRPPEQHKQRHSSHHHRRRIHHHENDNKQLRKRRLLEDTVTTITDSLQQQYRYLAHGYWRDTWMYRSPSELIAFKTMRLHHDLTEYLMDKQRRDAVTSDRLTFSSQTIKMYGYCGTSALYEYAPGGDLERLITQFDSAKDFTHYFSSAERLLLAYNVTCALGDVHTTEGPKSAPAIVHGDFKADQFVAVTPADPIVTPTKDKKHRHLKEPAHKLPHFKLGDFNLARLVYWNKKYNHPCVVKPDGNGGRNRAPEEYAKEKGRTEKLDIYSLGNLLYTILTGHFPFDDLDASGTAEMKVLVQKGRRPHVNIDADIRHSKDPIEQAMLRAIEMCWEHDPRDRPSAREVEAILVEHLPRKFVRRPRHAKDLRRNLK